MTTAMPFFAGEGKLYTVEEQYQSFIYSVNSILFVPQRSHTIFPFYLIRPQDGFL
jgi:hypothetical protein